MRNRNILYAMLILLITAEANAGLLSKLRCRKRQRCVTQELSLERRLGDLLSEIPLDPKHQSQPPEGLLEDDDRPGHIKKYLVIDCWKGIGRLGHFSVPYNIGRWRYPLNAGDKRSVEFAITYHGHGSYLRQWYDYED
ncbi:MAG: hypothetical protein COA78_36460 [Blastopirellula sp.]|nr:MAG: hypothetical protein COA78_36460 [Blastopirellula sp.]